MIVGVGKLAMYRYCYLGVGRSFSASYSTEFMNLPIPPQAAFNRAKRNFSPQSTGAVLCGQKQMTEVRCYFISSQFVPS